MKNDKLIRIGVLGAGVVGSGVIDTIATKADFLNESVGHNLQIVKVLVKDATKKRENIPSGITITTDASDIIDDDNIDIIVELIGGEHPALEYIERSLTSGKSVVSANKEVIAKHGNHLFSLARENNALLLFEASVAGGIPIIGPLINDLNANQIQSIRSIINGTTNYILTKMTNEQLEFTDVLKDAQELGYAESDPTNDVQGIDAAYKLAILTNLAFGSNITDREVYREGITRLTSNDFKYAKELGYTIKLLAISKLADNKLEVRVHPSFIQIDESLAKIDGVLNAVEINGDLAGRVLFQGSGAGSLPTASSVVSNILAVCNRISSDHMDNVLDLGKNGFEVKPINDVITKYYIRVKVTDKPGVMGQIATILGKLGISIASLIQKESDPHEKTAELVIITHPSLDRDIRTAVTNLEQLESINEIGNVIIIEEQDN
ncbi:MAG: homoserine dehydrogenase [Dehalococcoidia bacterium]|nr:homoserine dehydrogenase [Dehalococcoidia bacterium]